MIDEVVLARVVRVDRTAYDVLTPAGPLRVPALPPAAEPVLAPTVGDWLELCDGVPVGMRPRTSLLARGSASGRSNAQPLAANVDIVLICAGLSAAVPVRRIERLLTLAWDSGATPVVVLTKADLCGDPQAEVERVQPYAPGVEVVTVAAGRGEVAALAPYLAAGTTLVLLGPSGSGKSTLVNTLAGAEVAATGETRAVDGKGRHVTTHRELIELPGGAVIIDTPGLRGVSLFDNAEGFALAFTDVEDLGTACRFADCRHESEPGCAVLATVAAGDLPQARVDSWRHLQKELAWQARRADARLARQERSKWKATSIAQRAHRPRP